jgi:protein-disulfide isomerase
MKIINAIRGLVQRTLGKSDRSDDLLLTAQGTLRVSGDKAVLHLANGMVFEASLTHDQQDSKFVVRITGMASTLANKDIEPLERRYDLSEVVQAREFYKARVDAWRRTLATGNVSASNKRGALVWLASGAVGVVVLSLMFGPGGVRQTQTMTSLSQADAAVLAAREQAQQPDFGAMHPAAAAKPDAVAVLTAEEAKKVAGAGRIMVRDGKQMLVAFSDPNCPSCHDLDSQASHFDGTTGLTVIPVAYKEGSRDLAAAILCSANPGKAWTDSMMGQRPSNAPCDKGYAQVDANRALFEKIGGTATPTLVAPNGSLAAGSADTNILVAWVAAHS